MPLIGPLILHLLESFARVSAAMEQRQMRWEENDARHALLIDLPRLLVAGLARQAFRDADFTKIQHRQIRGAVSRTGSTAIQSSTR